VRLTETPSPALSEPSSDALTGLNVSAETPPINTPAGGWPVRMGAGVCVTAAFSGARPRRSVWHHHH